MTHDNKKEKQAMIDQSGQLSTRMPSWLQVKFAPSAVAPAPRPGRRLGQQTDADSPFLRRAGRLAGTHWRRRREVQQYVAFIRMLNAKVAYAKGAQSRR
ncbi:MAG: hypothetical protein V5B36_15370 [Candidatus Accumulibacter sp. UW25]|jgi:hypothetical protein